MTGKADILLVTATKPETRALIEAFESYTGKRAKPHQIGGRSYLELGETYQASIWIAECEMGSIGIGAAQESVTKAIQSLEPKAVIMVGLAFGVKQDKHAIGEILISKRITLYEQRRIGKTEIVRGDRVTASPFLLSRMRLAEHFWKGAPVHSGLLLTGEKLVDDLKFRKELLNFEPEAIGGDMDAGKRGHALPITFLRARPTCLLR